MTTINKMRYNNANIDGLNIFYREAGDKKNPTILLLGGFPSSSITFSRLMDELKNDFHLIAPDYPGFGNSDAPPGKDYVYTFDNIASTMDKFIDHLGLTAFNLYAFDYGGPIGFRIASSRPQLIQSLIIQNANAYAEGIGNGFDAAMPFLQDRNEETEKPIRFLMTLDGIKVFYFTGVNNKEVINPDNYLSDLQNLSKPGLVDIHLDLLHNYSSNIPQFEKWQNYFSKYQPKTLLVWGKNDVFFPEAAATAYLKDLPNASLHLYDTGHFALEEYVQEIADNIRVFLVKESV
jgi:pimeloyl-ACP methyl ester carboxylesterase